MPTPRDAGGWLRGLTRPGVVAAAVGAAAIAVYVFGVRGLSGPLDPATAELWVLFLVFTVAELYVSDARDRSELVPLSPHEAGLVLGFFLLAPTDLVLAQLAGATVALGGVNLGRLRIDLLALRIATLALGTCLGLVVFHAILGDADHTGPVGWVGAIAGASIAAGTSLALGFVSRPRQRNDEPLFVTAAITAGAALASSSIALAAVALARNSDIATILLIVPFAACALILRAYASERMRLKHLQTLYESMRTAQQTTGLDEGVAELLGTTRRLVRADVARLVLFPRNGSSTLVASMTPAGHEPLQPTKLTAVTAREHPGSCRLGTHDPRLGGPDAGAAVRAPPRRAALREVMLTPLRVESEIRGVLLVGDRANAERFRTEHLRLLETYAGHAGVLIENDRLEESVTELTELKDQLRHQAYHDALTGLPNRMLFAERVGRSLDDGDVGGTAVLFLDLDDFKTINDSLGHYVGDQLLIAVARRVESCIRPIDLPARLGGDEFAVLLRRTTTAEAEQIADRLVHGHRAAVRHRQARHHDPRQRRHRAQRRGRLRRRRAAAERGRRDVRREARREAQLRHLRARDAHAGPRAAGARLRDRAGRRAWRVRRPLPADRRPRATHARRVRGAGPLEPPRPRRRRAREPSSRSPTSSATWSRSAGRCLREACRQARSWELAYPNHAHLTVNVNLAPSELQNPELVA